MNWYNKLTDKFGFTIPLIVQGGMVTVSMLALSTGALTAVGYVSLGIAAVIFAPRAFEKGIYEKSYIRKSIYFFNYALLAFYSIFIGISFSLAGTLKLNEISGMNITVDNDPVLHSLEGALLELGSEFESESIEFSQSSRESTIQGIQSRQEQSKNEIIEYRNKIDRRIADITSGKATRRARAAAATMTADDIFESIPVAWRTGRRIQVLFWMCLIFGIELMIINALAMPGKRTRTRRKIEKEPIAKKPRAKKAAPKKPRTKKPTPKSADTSAVTQKAIHNWLKVGFYGLESGRSAKTLAKKTCEEFQQKMGGTFDGAQFDRIEELARKAQVIDNDNNILVADKATAAGLMEFNL